MLLNSLCFLKVYGTAMELSLAKIKPISEGAIYCPPNNDNFVETFEKQ